MSLEPGDEDVGVEPSGEPMAPRPGGEGELEGPSGWCGEAAPETGADRRGEIGSGIARDRWPRAVPGTRFADVRHLVEVGSTNQIALEAAAAGAPEGLVVVADHQRSGRGRLGRRWEAPAGTNLLVSLLLRPAMAWGDLHRCTAVLAMAAADACREVAGVELAGKWPNDLVAVGSARSSDARAPQRAETAERQAQAAAANVQIAREGGQVVGGATSTSDARAPDERAQVADGQAQRAAGEAKVAGVLAEAAPGRAGDPAPAALVVGMGMNVGWPGPGDELPDEIGQAATSLWALAGWCPSRPALLVATLRHAEQRLADLEHPAGRRRQAEAYRRWCITLGQAVRVELPAGVLLGTAVDITDAGSLVVEDGSSRHVVTAGDVVHLRSANREGSG